jgi:Zn-dependent peptidase ImmA (M78 family)
MKEFHLYYEPTELEISVNDFYRDLGIHQPSDLCEDAICSALDIDLIYKPFPSMVYQADDYTSILIDSRLPRAVQREHFYHELGHIVRGHVGKQHKLTKSFRQLQEEQAEHFVMYAALPFFLIRQLPLPKYERDIIGLLADEFGVTHKLAARRLEQIKNRIYYGQAREEFVKKLRSQYSKAEPQPYSAETIRLLEQLKRQVAKKGE